MRFVDEVKIWVQSGDGGNGCLSFRREKFIPRGGPDGGNGGRGGHVILVASNKNPTLLDHSYQQHYRAPRGAHGKGKLQHGRNAKDLQVLVPVGTVVRDAESGEILKDLVQAGERLVVAHGGRGGKGNAAFKSSTNRAPRKVQPGEEGEQRRLKLELKLLADVGLVGLPNAGKSTLISTITSAQPKIANYPFTTLTPQLGVVNISDSETMVLADIPGIIEGAHQGAGLGLRFLRHIERTNVLVILIDVSAVSPEDPGRDYRTIMNECENHDPALVWKPQVIVLNKADMLASQEFPVAMESYCKKLGKPYVLISALTGFGIDNFLDTLRDAMQTLKSN